MSIIKVAPRGYDLTDTYAFTGTVSGVDAGSMVKILSTTASGNATRSFTSGIDSTYRTYLFKFINIHAQTDSQNFQFQGSTQGASSTDGDYSNTITSTFFVASHNENDAATSLGYDSGDDLAQSSSFQTLTGGNVGNANDESISGELWLFNPSSTTYVKHFIANIQINSSDDKSRNSYIAGYFNTTSAINAIRFKFASGNIDDGTIVMYGIA